MWPCWVKDIMSKGKGDRFTQGAKVERCVCCFKSLKNMYASISISLVSEVLHTPQKRHELPSLSNSVGLKNSYGSYELPPEKIRMG